MKLYANLATSNFLIILSIVLALLTIAATYYAGNILSAPHKGPLSEPAKDLLAEDFYSASSGASLVKGWLIKGDAPGVIILLHGLRSDRRQMLDRARFLTKAGYTVILPDLQAHGESPGRRITWGYRESRGVKQTIAYVRETFPSEPVAIIGVSLGGAASLLGEVPAKVDALILESVYSEIKRAIENRLVIYLGKPGMILAPLFCWQIQAWHNIPLASLSPISSIKNLTSPVLIMAGTKDRRTRLRETLDLYEAAPGKKSLWLIEQARHQDLHRFSPAEYQRRVLHFLRENM